MKVVIDTSPLQALWRGGVLELALRKCSKVVLPPLVADETRQSMMLVGRRLVPDLDQHQGIQVQPVAESDVRTAMASLLEANFKRRRGGKQQSAPEPEVRFVGSKVVASAGKRCSISFDVPNIQVVVLAKDQDAIAILDDRKTLRAASDFGVPTLTTREFIARIHGGDMEATTAAIEKIEATGYHPTQRMPPRTPPSRQGG